jgi:organic radical activating enzyme
MTEYRDWLGQYNGPIIEPAKADECIAGFKSVVDGKKVILYGAQHHGRAVASVLSHIGVEIFAFVDRRAGDLSEALGKPVHSPHWLTSLTSPSEYVLICATNPQNHALIAKDIKALLGDALVLEDGFLGHTLLRTSYCAGKCARGERLDLANCAECSVMNHTCPTLRLSLKKARNRPAVNPAKAGTQTLLGYILGQRCTLRCDHCVEGTPDIEARKKEFTPKSVVLSDIRKMTAASDFITVLDFAGGEPFLHPDLVEILQETKEIENIGIINIFTNGTVKPNEKLIDALCCEKVTVTVSSYSNHLSQSLQSNIAATVSMLRSRGCQCYTNENKTWLDCSSFDFVDDDETALKHRFKNCVLANCQRLDRGTIYRCLHQYAGAVTGRFLDAPEAIHIHQFSDEELARKLDRFNALPYISTCSHCQLPFDAAVVPAGVQRQAHRP